MESSPLPVGWQELLAHGCPKEQLLLLPLIERYATTEICAYTALLPLAVSQDFALRLRALLALGRLQQVEAFLPLVQILSAECFNHWRLAVLDTLFMLPYPDKISPLLPLLAQDQPGDEDAFFLSGLVWFLGQQGELGIAPLTDMLLAKPVRSRRLKDDLLAEAIFAAAAGDINLLAGLSKHSPPLARFCDNRVWPKSKRASFGIYPNPDYLLQKALQAGVSKEQYKKLHHWYRRKKGAIFHG